MRQVSRALVWRLTHAHARVRTRAHTPRERINYWHLSHFLCATPSRPTLIIALTHAHTNRLRSTPTFTPRGFPTSSSVCVCMFCVRVRARARLRSKSTRPSHLPISRLLRATNVRNREIEAQTEALDADDGQCTEPGNRGANIETPTTDDEKQRRKHRLEAEGLDAGGLVACSNHSSHLV